MFTTGDYVREAASQEEYRQYVLADPVLSQHCQVPQVYPELCTERILTTRLVPGFPIDQAVTLSQDVRNAIARAVLIITIRELFEWRFIQSDPNYANFLYDHPGKTIYIIDFGAARRYNKSFVDGYMKLVWAASNKDTKTILTVSKELGFITGKLLFSSFSRQLPFQIPCTLHAVSFSHHLSLCLFFFFFRT